MGRLFIARITLPPYEETNKPLYLTCVIFIGISTRILQCWLWKTQMLWWQHNISRSLRRHRSCPHHFLATHHSTSVRQCHWVPSVALDCDTAQQSQLTLGCWARTSSSFTTFLNRTADLTMIRFSILVWPPLGPMMPPAWCASCMLLLLCSWLYVCGGKEMTVQLDWRQHWYWVIAAMKTTARQFASTVSMTRTTPRIVESLFESWIEPSIKHHKATMSWQHNCHAHKMYCICLTFHRCG